MAFFKNAENLYMLDSSWIFFERPIWLSAGKFSSWTKFLVT